MKRRSQKLKPSPEMDKAVQNMFALPPADVKRIVKTKPGRRRKKARGNGAAPSL